MAGSYSAFTGDFDGDGVDDLLWYAPGPADDGVWYGNRNRSFTRVKIKQDLIGGMPTIADLDGDGRDDVIWYGVNGSSDAIWWSNGRGWTAQVTTIGGPFVPVSVTDNADGRDEVLFIGGPGAASYRWEFSPSRQLVSTRLTAPGMKAVPTVGDFDGDGRDDVFLLAYDRRSSIWWSTPTGVVAHGLTTGGGYTATAGFVEQAISREGLLLVSSRGPDHLLRSSPDRTITSSQVG